MKVEKYEPGRFCWAELATTDTEDAKRFYGGLFGWAASDLRMGKSMTYSMFALHGESLSAAYPQGETEKSMGIPPTWRLHISVANADDTTTKAQELGALIVVGPIDVQDSGRMSIIQDPTGAQFEIWEAKAFMGATIKQEPGAVDWNELYSSDLAASTEFYTQLFGWTADVSEMPQGSYTVFMDGDEQVAGMMGKPENIAGMPDYWSVYFNVANCDAAVDKVQELGGKLELEAMDVEGVGRFAVLSDPEGAVFSVMEAARGSR